MSFCVCGRPLIIKNGELECPRHGKDFGEKPKRDRIGDWSGPTKRYKGAYERY